MDWSKYINIPWEENHCIDLVNKIAKLEGFGWQIGDGGIDFLSDAHNMERLERNLQAQNLIAITDYNQLQENDLMIFRFAGIVHVGICVGKDKVLHVLPPWFGFGFSEITDLSTITVMEERERFNGMKRCFIKAYRK